MAAGSRRTLITLTWLRLDGLKRWRSLAVLALLIALATVKMFLIFIAGVRGGQRVSTGSGPGVIRLTATGKPRSRGSNRRTGVSEVTALTKFPVVFGYEAQGYTGASTGFPLADDQMTRTIERPVMVAGRLFNPRRTDEVMVTPKFATTYGKHVGDTLTLELASPQQANSAYDGTSGPPRGPKIRVRIVGEGRSPWALDADSPDRPAASPPRPPCSPGTAST